MSLKVMTAKTLLLVILLISTINAADKKQASIEKINQANIKELRAGASLATADTCIVRHDNGIILKIDSWVLGNELYKNYLDPSLSCPNPYPFTVTEVNMPMYFLNPTTINVSVDVESADYSDPNCPTPDTIIAMSSTYSIQVPGEGLYDIWVPLDTPVIVDGPFFAGYFLGNPIDQSVGAAVLTDTNSAATCRSYNIWSDTIGYIDLLNNSIWNFPGRLVLYASGIPGGQSTDPPPDIVIISPQNNQNLYGSSQLWVNDISGSNIIDYVSFEYSNGGAFTEIGRDYDPSSPLRDGLHYAETGNGFSISWNFSSLPEGAYILRATAYDTLGRSASDEINVYLEPTPPTPNIISPLNGSDFCPTFDFLMSCSDENMTRIDIYKKDADSNYTAGMVALNQYKFGDNNGNPNDGNRYTNGEFGDYYSAPTAAASAIKLWADRGYTYLMREGVINIPVDTLVERMATLFKTRENKGTYDEDLYKGLIDFNSSKGNPLIINYSHNPDYFQLRSMVENEEKTVIIALGGTPGVWLAIDGFQGWKQLDGTFQIKICNPFTGNIIPVAMRNNMGVNEVYFNGNWQKIDMMVTVGAVNWNVTRTYLGSDTLGTNGWSFTWTPQNLISNHQYFFHAIGIDATGLKDNSTVLLNYDCSQFFIRGDYNNDGFTNIADLNYLINYLIYGGPPPLGGAIRGDANCDNYINITDIVYYINFIFGVNNPPCY